MRVALLHHPADAALAASVVREMTPHGFSRAGAVAEAEVALVLVSGAALRDGLGGGLRAALAAGLPVLPLLVEAELVPPELPVHRKHVPLAGDAQTVVRHLLEHRERGEARQIESKRALFGQGVLLALLHRG
jgi:hypothetical protein